MPKTTTVRHPAKFSDEVLETIKGQLKVVKRWGTWTMPTVLDPFAGVGKIHILDDLGLAATVGVELEPEWAVADQRTIVGDALHLKFADDSFDGVITSPCYGNRMADHHEAADKSRRNTYRHALGRMPSEGSAAVMQWGPEYRVFHHEAMEEMLRVARTFVMVNMSNHIRKGVEQDVVGFWRDRLVDFGCKVKIHDVTTPRLRHGANHDVRVKSEVLIVGRVS